MRLRIVQTLVFILCSILDVRVRAAELSAVQIPSQSEVIEQPLGCLKSITACGLTTFDGRKYVLKFKGASVTLGPNTVVIREPSDSIDLVKGMLLVEAKSDFSVKVPSGELVLSADGIFLVERSVKGVSTLTVLKGQGQLVTLGRAQEPLVVPVGFQNWFGPVGSKGKATVGIPRTLDASRAIRTWATLFSGTKNEFRDLVRTEQPEWREAIEASSALEQNIAVRTIASEDEKAKHEAEAKRVNAEQRRRVRKWFYEKTFEY